MPIVTRTVAKGIPPRLHESKPKHKGRKSHTTSRQTKKRNATSSDSESESEQSEPKKKRTKKRQHIDSSELESGVEVVDVVEPPAKEIEEEEAGGIVREADIDDAEEVSNIIDWDLSRLTKI